MKNKSFILTSLFFLFALLFLHEARVIAAQPFYVISIFGFTLSPFDIFKLSSPLFLFIVPLTAFKRMRQLVGSTSAICYLIFIISFFISLLLSIVSPSNNLLMYRLREFSALFTIPILFLLSNMISRERFIRSISSTFYIIGYSVIFLYLLSPFTELPDWFSLWPGQFAVIYIIIDSRLLKMLRAKSNIYFRDDHSRKLFSLKFKNEILNLFLPIIEFLFLLSFFFLFPSKPVIGCLLLSVLMELLILLFIRDQRRFLTLITYFLILVASSGVLSWFVLTNQIVQEFVAYRILKLPEDLQFSLSISEILDLAFLNLSGDSSLGFTSDISGGRFDLFRIFIGESHLFSSSLGDLPDFSTRGYNYVIHPHNSFAYFSYTFGLIGSISFYLFNISMAWKTISCLKLLSNYNMLSAGVSFSTVVFSFSILLTELYSGVFLYTSWLFLGVFCFLTAFLQRGYVLKLNLREL